MTRGVEAGPHGDPARWDMVRGFVSRRARTPRPQAGTLDVGYEHSSDAVSDECS